MSLLKRAPVCSLAAVCGLLLVFPADVAAAGPPERPRISLSVQSATSPAAATELTPPAIAQEGGKAMLSAEVEGAGPLVFQWFVNGQPVADATNAVHVVDLLERADEGSYSVAVANEAGETTSDPARLLISNVRPDTFVGLRVTPPAGGAEPITYAESLAAAAVWRVLTGVTSSVAPLLLVDPGVTNGNSRFYKTPVTQDVEVVLLPGWSYRDPAGSVHAIEFLEPASGVTNWQRLDTITLPESPHLFVDTSATNGLPRRYRTTLIESPSARRVGRLVFTTQWILPPDAYASLMATHGPALTARGMVMNDFAHAIETATNALPGYWIAVGDQRVMTDTNGEFEVDVPFGVTWGSALAHPQERTTPALAIFEVNRLVAPGHVPESIVVRFQNEGLLNMNGPRGATSRAGLRLAGARLAGDPVCGDPCGAVGNAGACCLDYNGLVSDGCRYPDADAASFGQKLVRYLGSTCHQLVEAGLCANEWNALRFVRIPVPPFVIPAAPLSGPPCFENHKYRNCQNVARTDFALASDTLEVRCGESVVVVVHNNTWANETELSLGPASLKHPGRLTGQRLNAGTRPRSYTQLHYDDIARQHLADQSIQYTAPTQEELQAAGGVARVVITAKAGGETRTLELRVACCGPLDDPAVTPVANLVYIQPGTFTMGSPASEPARQDREGPQTQVTISCGFYMGKYEVTQGEYQAVMGGNPSYHTGDLSRPVEKVSWHDAVAYCAALTARERAAGRLPAGYAYRLPTEAEWEYACRAGTTTAFHYGDALRSGMANFSGYHEYPPCGQINSPTYCYNAGGTSLTRPTSVGSYAPNAWGLYDLHGNVWEWCQDWWSGSLPGGEAVDPRGSESGSSRVLRGGYWGSYGWYCRSAFRYSSSPDSRTGGIGFRVVLATD